MEPSPKTFEQMCATIVEAGFLRKKTGELLTAQEIFNYSPTGELYMLFEWYELAVKILAAKASLRAILLRLLEPCPNPELEARVKDLV